MNRTTEYPPAPPRRPSEQQDVENETYVVTPLGVLAAVLNPEDARRAIDALELHMRRHYGATPGIVVDGDAMLFAALHKETEQ